MSCNPDKIKAALFEQAEEVKEFVDERIRQEPRLALRMIPDGGVVRRNASKTTVIYGEARQASVAYKDLDNDPRPLVEGEMTGRSLTGANGIFDTNINDIDDNACHGQCTIDFAQGYRTRSAIDKELSVDTPVKCVRELDRLGREHIIGYFRAFKNQFQRFGLDNFSDNLINLTIQQGEANSSVLSHDQFNMSTAGWVAPPTNRISIFWLQEYRDQIMATMRGFGWNVPDNWKLEVEMPREDWMEAVYADQIARNPQGTSYEVKIFEDVEGPMRSRSASEYGGIKCYFNERPIRGYFRQTGVVGGQPVYNFVRVYDWVNEPDEQAGLVVRPNHQYRQDTITVGGVTYDMVTLIPHIDRRSFRRYGLMKPLKPIGGKNSGVNYEVKVIDGAYLPCNDHDDKFKLAARHEFRFKAIYPEVSGWIAYRHGRRSGYDIEVVSRSREPLPNTPANPEVFRTCAPDNCMQAECEQCNKLPTINGACEDPGNVTPGTLNLVPCGNVEVAFLGEELVVRLEVTRSGDVSGAASVDWATAHVTTDASDLTPASGTLEWAPGDNSPKVIEVTILDTFSEATPGTADTFTVTISNPDGDLLGTCTVATVAVSDLTP